VALIWQRNEVNGLATRRGTLKAQIEQLNGDLAEIEETK